jgi:ribonuclease HI
MKVNIYCDGCYKKIGHGGYGFLIEIGSATYVGGGYALSASNNIMELLALIKALERLREIGSELGFLGGLEVTFTSDSQYVVNGFNQWMTKWRKFGWRKSINGQGVKNPILWLMLYHLKEQIPSRGCWIRGHTGHAQNEECDAIANYCCANQVSLKGIRTVDEGPAFEDMIDRSYVHQEKAYMKPTETQAGWLDDAFKQS